MASASIDIEQVGTEKRWARQPPPFFGSHYLRNQRDVTLIGRQPQGRPKAEKKRVLSTQRVPCYITSLIDSYFSASVADAVNSQTAIDG
jgi:hypothetical protein